jgi:hypothetical protein
VEPAKLGRAPMMRGGLVIDWAMLGIVAAVLASWHLDMNAP